MKKSFIIISSLLLTLTLVGCVSQKDFDELENRVSILEGSSNITTSTSTSINSTEKEDNIIEDNSNIDEFSNYDISNESSQDIVNDIIYFIDNRPKNNENFNDIYARFQDKTLDISKSTKEYHYITLKYTNRFDNSDLYWIKNLPNNIKDEFITVEYLATPAMNNTTVDIDENHIYTNITFTIVDYNKAKEIFKLLENYLNETIEFSDIYSTTESTTWTIDFNVNGCGSNYVKLTQIDGGYLFNIDIR